MELSAALHGIQIADATKSALGCERGMTDLSAVTDDNLLEQMAAGSEEAFLALYERRQGPIYRFALQMSGSVTVAEDVTQDVFLTLMKVARNFDRRKGVAASFLYGIARNLVLKRHEADRNFLPISDEGDEGSVIDDVRFVTSFDPVGEMTRAETIDRVRKAVLALPHHYREAVVFCDLHDLTYAQAAEIIGCRVGTVRSRLHRGRAILLSRFLSAKDRNDTDKKTKREASFGVSV